MRLYYHKTDGGAEYLMDTFIQCPNGHKEGTINSDTKFIVRIDGDITKDAELNTREPYQAEPKLDKKFFEDCRVITDYLLENEEKNWLENDKPRAHIYCYARRVRKQLIKFN